jgi:general secretion pathway protein E
LETAQIAVQASLTGHLVLATLHTNDAAGAVTRLIDMGIEPFLLASSLLGVMAQRLVRRLCVECRSAYPPPESELAMLPPAARPPTLHAAQGCPACGHTGYRGRTGIYELMALDQNLRRMIHDSHAEQQIHDYALAHGMTGLREDGARWVADGTTSLEEVLRVTRESTQLIGNGR